MSVISEVAVRTRDQRWQRQSRDEVETGREQSEQILSTRLQLALRLLACSRRQLRSPHYPSISAAEHLATSLLYEALPLCVFHASEGSSQTYEGS